MLPPADAASWTRDAAAHLLGRAGFGATPLEVESTWKLGRARAIAALFVPPPPGPELQLASAEPEATPRADVLTMTPQERETLKRQIQQQNRLDLEKIRGWWIGQMVNPPSAVLEKATLFWHGHFATSVQKVKSAAVMWQQNQLLRKFAFGNFRDLVKAISCDPAMVVWLDLQQSRNGAPNENFARELMELFTLGIGHYSEDDIKNSARAFTGYRTRLRQAKFDYIEQQHDDSDKVFMGKKGRFSGDDIIDIIFEQPACAEFICTKLWTFYAYEEPEPVLIGSLAHTLRQANYEIRPVLMEMFGSKAFYRDKAMATQIKSPVQLIAQTCRTLECNPPPSFALQFIMRSLGQMLLAPPNVKGWDGNRSWINTATLASRIQFTDSLAGVGTVEKQRGFAGNLPLEKLVTDEMLNDCVKLIDGFTFRLLDAPIDQSTRADLIADAEKYSKPLSRTAVKEALAKVMRLPEFQLV
ncbi:MAG: DUF1800 domain-containing protein [Chthoniobacterales bacterium]